MNLTPEQAATLASGATPVQILTMIFLGIIVLWILICIVRWVIKMKIGTLPEDIKELNKKMTNNSEILIEMKGKLWSEDKVKSEFEKAIEHHKMECPAWRSHCSKLGTKENND